MDVTGRVEQLVRLSHSNSTARVFIAYSGGLDSTVLLHAAQSVFTNTHLIAVHVNHGIHAEADQWQAHCESEVRSRGMEWLCQRIDIGEGNLENAGRQARYRIIADLVEDGDVVLTGHHMNDNVESILWQLFTGRAPVGIAKQRSLGSGMLHRPLLELQKHELSEYAVTHNLRWIEDTSNEDVTFDRNFIRHRILPLITERFPQAFQSLDSSQLPALVAVPKAPLRIDEFNIQERVVRSWLSQYGITPGKGVLFSILEQAFARLDAVPEIRVTATRTVRRYKNHLFVVNDTDPLPTRTIQVNDDVVVQGGRLGWRVDSPGLQAGSSYTVSARKGGEEICIQGHRRRVSSLLYSKGLPPWQRQQWPLVWDQQTVIAVPNIGLDSDYAVANGFVPTWTPVA